jgi:hypothetical protein
MCRPWKRVKVPKCVSTGKRNMPVAVALSDLLGAMIAAFIGVALLFPRQQGPTAEGDETAVYFLSRAPMEVAACMSHNLPFTGHHEASVQALPLSGTSKVGVTIRDRPTGDVIAVAVITEAPISSTSVAAVTAMAPGAVEHQRMVKQLADGC